MAGNDAFTKILLHFDGADASTTFTDDNAGGSAHTWTASGNAQLDTGVTPKFGSAAGLFDGTGDYITTPDSADFALGAGEFTVDFWFNVAGGSGARRTFCGQCSAAAADVAFFIELNASNVVNAQVTTNGGSSYTTVTGTTAFTATGWHHVAFVRSVNTLKLFVNGVQEGGDVAFPGTITNSAQSFGVGSLGAFTSLTWNGSIDEFRLSVGTARWTSNFTPPTAAYDAGSGQPYIKRMGGVPFVGTRGVW